MNRKVSKRISKKALQIAVEWLKSMLSDEEAAKVSDTDIPRDNPPVYREGVAYSIPFSYRGSKQIIKRLIRKNPSLVIENITMQDIENYRVSVGRP
jgi:hypothetical protein